jgi:hypothetical protein
MRSYREPTITLLGQSEWLRHPISRQVHLNLWISRSDIVLSQATLECAQKTLQTLCLKSKQAPVRKRRTTDLPQSETSTSLGNDSSPVSRLCSHVTGARSGAVRICQTSRSGPNRSLLVDLTTQMERLRLRWCDHTVQLPEGIVPPPAFPTKEKGFGLGELESTLQAAFE